MEPTNTSEARKNQAYHTRLRDAERAVDEKHLAVRGKVGRPPRFERRAVNGRDLLHGAHGRLVAVAAARPAAVAHRVSLEAIPKPLSLEEWNM